jgi:hypothetical protein
MPVIDMHPTPTARALRRWSKVATTAHGSYQRDLSPEGYAIERREPGGLGGNLRDPAARREAMKRMRVGLQVIAPARAQQYYWASSIARSGVRIGSVPRPT